MKTKIIYYADELNDEFSTAKITPKKIGDEWVYVHTSAWKKFTHFFWYRIIATPIAYLYLKIKFGHKIVGRNAIKKFKKGGFFLYGNHTQDVADAFIPSMLTFPRASYVIVHPNNVSMPVLGRVTPSMGALPLPDTLNAAKKFSKAVETRYEQGNAVVIYPEAHIWPYYTYIRPFTDASFRYPVKSGAPVFCFTNTYQKRKWTKIPRIVTYVDGPFYPDERKPFAERKKQLRDEVYAKMKERSLNSNVEMIKYVKIEGELPIAEEDKP